MRPLVLPLPPDLPKVDYDLPREQKLWNGLVLVGEAPGKDEVRLGRPFVGRSGQLLNEILAEAGIERSLSVVANVFRFQPPGNKVGHFFTSRRTAAREKTAIAEQAGPMGSLWCKEDFYSEINNLSETLRAWKPRIIIALGRTPFWALGGGNGLIANAGRVFDCSLLPGTPVMPTFHPSYILRGNWSKRPEWLEHFRSATHYVAEK